ncbi:hypothetical protein Sp245p_28785 (plasmid) [Azospirillum baldaniorum]|uniref:Uncharacterized protein n=1 Tax=Azospirillum baldaniorum TaxID=1064539 RepID=A0A9P1JXZ7_9PROT|nr:hypothetical protein [Azospirillum baldaniorum]AWJ93819.1 hypothetical protein Sp245p_28785 [Azospirillum baldaniorum]TWA81642.1 hypothetical protein FBZ85_10216 [Azospirillum brasilense]CCD01975.1 conserved protein of unknown function [Azospirillum baldaniorum]
MLTNGSVPDVHRVLRERNALVVHFSGTPKGIGFTIGFPDDLRESIANAATYALACSVVKPGDCFIDFPPPHRRHATGSIGIILDLMKPQSLMAVCETDAGSNAARQHRPLTIQDCVDSIDKRSDSNTFAYNEWNVTDYVVRGLFVADPIQYYGFMTPTLPNGSPVPYSGPTPAPIDSTVNDLHQIFPQQRIYGFEGDGIVEYHPRGVTVPVSHSEIYR